MFRFVVNLWVGNFEKGFAVDLVSPQLGRPRVKIASLASPQKHTAFQIVLFQLVPAVRGRGQRIGAGMIVALRYGSQNLPSTSKRFNRVLLSGSKAC